MSTTNTAERTNIVPIDRGHEGRGRRRFFRASTLRTADGHYWSWHPGDGGLWHDAVWCHKAGHTHRHYSTAEELEAEHGAASVYYTAEDALRRWPRVVAHLICESLGYFTPEAAAMAVARHLNGQPHHCEYYSHCAAAQVYEPMREYTEAHGRRCVTNESYHAIMLAVGRDRLSCAIRFTARRKEDGTLLILYPGRHSHRGYMSDYGRALKLVFDVAGGGRGPDFASWF
jgi:hypothetical protein